MQITTLALVLVLILGGVGIGYDLSRHPCQSRVRKVIGEVRDWYDEWRWGPTWNASYEQPIFGYFAPRLTQPDWRSSLHGNWHDVQTGELTLLPELEVLLLAPPAWKGDPVVAAGEFEAEHPDLVPLSLERAEPFLLYQTGGGAEGIALQVVLTRSGGLYIWEFPRGDRTGFPRAVVTRGAAASERLLSRALEAELATKSTVNHACGVLDGGTDSLVYYDGSRVGRVHLINFVHPPGVATELMVEIRDLAIATLEATD